MGNVIYSASPLQTFLGSFGMIAFFFGLGAISVAAAIFRRKERSLVRIAMGGAGGVLLLAGLGMVVVTFRSMTSAAQTVAVRLDDKSVAQDNCGDGDTCSRYVLEMLGGPKAYDVQVSESTYERAQVGSCYQLTYYPGGGLFGASEYADAYEYITNIARIEAVDAALCQ